MQRRKFVVGMGALASGTAAAVGSGAFTSVQANRDVSVEVVGDANAFLALAASEDSNGDYVNDNGDLVELDFTGNDQGNSSGLNDRAFTNFESVLEVRNQGTQDIKVALQPEDGDPVPADFLIFLSRSPGSDIYNGGSPSEGEQGMRFDNENAYSVSDFPTLSPGEALTVGFGFNLNRNDDFETVIDDLDTVQIVAGTQEALQGIRDQN